MSLSAAGFVKRVVLAFATSGIARMVSSSTAVVRAFTNSFLCLLLLTTVVWGGCISCEQYFMWGGAKSCCTADGHCKTKQSPAKQSTSRECTQIAFDCHKSIDHHIQLPLVGALDTTLALAEIETAQRWHGVRLIEPSPPDLQVLHSTFLI